MKLVLIWSQLQVLLSYEVIFGKNTLAVSSDGSHWCLAAVSLCELVLMEFWNQCSRMRLTEGKYTSAFRLFIGTKSLMNVSKVSECSLKMLITITVITIIVLMLHGNRLCFWKLYILMVATHMAAVETSWYYWAIHHHFSFLAKAWGLHITENKMKYIHGGLLFKSEDILAESESVFKETKMAKLL